MILLKRVFFITLLAAFVTTAKAQIIAQDFARINLDYPGLETVKKAVISKKYNDAAAALLQYYRNRTSVRHLQYNTDDSNTSAGRKVNTETLKLADDILLHKFKPHKGYPTYDYGADINWQYRPVKDQLLTTFLHRTAFWESLGLAYRAGGDEKYAREWVFQVKDWIRKNKNGAYADDKDYAWKAFVVSFRLNHWSGFFNLFLNSPSFTPEFLMLFLTSYQEQADYVMSNYTDIGNHRLYEALHLMYAGSNFPEMATADTWRKSGITVLNQEIGKQVLPDGIQFELSPGYHIGTIRIFLDALRIARLTGNSDEFPKSYTDLVEKMVLGVSKYSFPDYTFPLFGNSFITTKDTMLKNYKDWAEAFPENKVIAYYAGNGHSGQKPGYLSTALPDAGFYTFRNGWDTTSTVMQIKAGPAAGFHSHPDNGNFVLWVSGRNFTPDAGSFVYANVGGYENAKRDWYRSTRVHQTLTLNNRNIENQAQLRKWETSPDMDILSYVNPSYPDLNHERTFLFIDKSYFVIIDRAVGSGTGQLDIRFNLKEDNKPVVEEKHNRVYTTYADKNNVLIQSFSDNTMLKEEESFVSYEYQKESPRPAFAFEQQKPDAAAKTFISLLYPFRGNQPPAIKLTENAKHNPDKGIIDLTISFPDKTRTIQLNLTP
ncbi:heparin-sulfate lyase HepC [Sphingobacterium spiritivorum]|uniref:heparin-sulfate lyase HepC n=1 Tax=Sphingobacterium spiritivorum TaxID=258 RepID=UPI003DA22A24